MPAIRVEKPEHEERVKPNLVPMIDVSFNLLTFFVMLLAISKDEAGQVIRLPTATSASVLVDDQAVDSLVLNVAFLDGPGGKHPTLMAWGQKLNLDDSNSWDRVTALIQTQANIEKNRQGPEWKKKGLSTTVIIRGDEEIDYSVFRRLVNICSTNGFTRFQLKAKG